MRRYSYMKNTLLIMLLFVSVIPVFAKDELPKDTLYTELKNDIVILSTTKETKQPEIFAGGSFGFLTKESRCFAGTFLKRPECHCT